MDKYLMLRIDLELESCEGSRRPGTAAAWIGDGQEQENSPLHGRLKARGVALSSSFM
jgi:hypothetical protein